MFPFFKKEESRVEQLLNKLLLKENKWMLPHLPIWIYESKQYSKMMMDRYRDSEKGEAGYRVLYIMNHVCPNLHHFHKAPKLSSCFNNVNEYNRSSKLHIMENSQAKFCDHNGSVIQNGVEYTSVELDKIIEFADRYCVR